MPPVTSPTAGCPGPRWRPSSVPAAGRAPARSPPTTRTPPPWASRRPGSPCGRSRRRRPTAALVRHRHARLPRQDQRHRRRTPLSACPPRSAAFDFGGALRSGIGALRDGARRARAPTLVVPSDLRDGLPDVRPTSRPAATAAAAVAGRRRRPGRAGGGRVPRRGVGHRRVPRPLAHARATGARGVGGALRRDPLRPARPRGLASGPQGRRASSPATSDQRGGHRHARPGRRRRLRRKLGLGAGRPGRRPHRDRRPDRAPPTRGSSSASMLERPAPAR